MLDPATFDITEFEARASTAAKLLRVLGNERRLVILCHLTEGERSVGELQPRVGLSQSALSQHLAVLREEGIVATRREGQVIWYRIIDAAATKVVGTLAGIFCPAADAKASVAARSASDAPLNRRIRSEEA